MRGKLRGKETIMAVHDRIRYLRKEHEELLHVADKIEEMLGCAAKTDVAERLKGVMGLRSLEHGLAGIVEHCHAEDRIVESTYHHSLQLNERGRIDAEHEQILRTTTDFREELKFATVDRTMAMIPPGIDLVNRLRAHIAYEREMLNRIDRQSPPKKAATKGATRERTSGSEEKARPQAEDAAEGGAYRA
jgi:hypothetical protein